MGGDRKTHADACKQIHADKGARTEQENGLRGGTQTNLALNLLKLSLHLLHAFLVWGRDGRRGFCTVDFELGLLDLAFKEAQLAFHFITAAHLVDKLALEGVLVRVGLNNAVAVC